MSHNLLTEDEQRAGWRLLFDGQSLDGWTATGKPEGWTVEDGCLVLKTRGGGYLTTVEQFENFHLQLDWKIEAKGNSGVFLRWSNLRDPVNTGIEIQILDSYGTDQLGSHTCGAIYDLVAPSKDVFKPAGEWNHYLIRCEGPIISVELNGEHVSEANIDEWTEVGKNPDGSPNKFTNAWATMPRKGHIGLQEHDGQLWFRNVKIKELP